MERLRVVQNQPEQPAPDYTQQMLDIIDNVWNYTESRKEKTLIFGDANLDKMFDGVEPHIYFVGGRPNAGKSAWFLSVAWNIVRANPNAYVIYHTLDDPDRLLLPRLAAMEARIPIRAALRPHEYEHEPNILNRRRQAFDNIRSRANQFKMLSSLYAETVEQIETIAVQHLSYFRENEPEKQVVLFIDNFHDLGSEAADGMEKQDRLQYIGKTLFDLSNEHNIPIFCTSELKKINSNRRPIQDDMRETIKLQYLAGAVMLVHNDLALKGPTLCELNWDENGETKPVLEVHITKNKVSGTKGIFFWEFDDKRNIFRVPSEGAIRAYTLKISG